MFFIRKAILFVVFLSWGCSSLSTITFSSKDDATIRAVDWGNIDSTGEIIGKTPIEVSMEKVKGKVLIISAPNKMPQYWVVPFTDSKKMEANLALADAPKSSDAAVNIAERGEEFQLKVYSRLLMRSYQALVSKDFKTTRELAAQMAKMAPQDPAPVIMTGLSSLQAGDKDSARIEFEKAKAMDPENAEISELLKFTQ